MTIMITIITIVLTIFIYVSMMLLYKRLRFPLFVPVATTTFVIIILLHVLNIPYEIYMTGGKWIGELLGPAVIAMALPLYQNRESVKKYFIPIFTSVVFGSTIGILTGFYFSNLFNLEEEIISSIIPKSVTTPIAMEISGLIGGIPTLAAVYVTVAGIFGAMFGPFILHKSNITHFVGVGVGFGTASHGIGTARALDIGQKEAAIGSIAMIISAIYIAIICPIVVQVLVSM